jgi:deoxyadenosine/deoxycytidine kinase
VEELVKNIMKRGREMERNISEEYLRKVQQSYFSYFKLEPEFPILVLDVGEMDLVDNENNFKQILRFIESPREKKIVWKKISE